ncbi:MAG: DUF4332 domain-containing protein [Myxococcota bacterium]
MANMKIQEIEGIGPSLGEKFAGAGVANTDTLLQKGCDRAGRKALSEATGLSESRILGFVNMADLLRIKGVGGEYAELLVAAGVDTVKELKTRNGANLVDKVTEVNTEKKLTRKVPTQSQIEDWIKQADGLPGVIEH